MLADGQQELNKGMSQMRGSAQDPVVARHEVTAGGSNDSVLEAEAAGQSVLAYRQLWD